MARRFRSERRGPHLDGNPIALVAMTFNQPNGIGLGNYLYIWTD